MGLSILNEKTASLLLKRAEALSVSSPGAWGTMNATDMLYHCNVVTNAILQGKAGDEKPTLKQRLLKIMVLRLMRHLPKGIKTNPKFVRPSTDTVAFEEQLSRLQETLLRFSRHSNPIASRHPLLGPLTTQDWRRFIWMHTDHHFRQFGV